MVTAGTFDDKERFFIWGQVFVGMGQHPGQGILTAAWGIGELLHLGLKACWGRVQDTIGTNRLVNVAAGGKVS